jgi:hypothetical protein
MFLNFVQMKKLPEASWRKHQQFLDTLEYKDYLDEETLNMFRNLDDFVTLPAGQTSRRFDESMLRMSRSRFGVGAFY